MNRSLKWAVLGWTAFGVSGCFMGYDSRWGQQKQAQQHVAAHETPQQLRRQSAEESARIAQRMLKLRVYASPTYAATVTNWQKQFDDLLECANAALTPEFGVALEVAETRSFRPASEEHLEGVLSELTADDSADDVDWVVGLVAAVPRFAASADDLGMAPLVGRHLVMRAMSDAKEYEAIQSAFSKLPEEQRLNLYESRKQHKLCTVFLHELAHALGVPHERLASSLMNPRYSIEESGLSDEASAIVRASLATRAESSSMLMSAELAHTVHAQLIAPDADWEPKSRDQLLSQIAPFEASPASPAPLATETVALALTAPAPDLSPLEQATYARARTELAAGNAANARDIAAPLFQAHPSSPELQSLRCDIAMRLGGDWDTILANGCQGLSPFESK
jgi:Matrixin